MDYCEQNVLGKSFLVYRFYRNELTPTARIIFAGTFVALLATMVIFAPSVSFKKSKSTDRLAVSIAVTPSEAEALRDSEPLFLPTAWNYRATHLREELNLKEVAFLPFGGVFYLGANESGRFVFEENYQLPEAGSALPVATWRLLRTFGMSPRDEGVQNRAGVPAARIVAWNSDTKTQLAAGFLQDESFDDPAMLLVPVEVVCYDFAGAKQFSIMQSSGNMLVDARILAQVRTWAKQNLRTRGTYSIRVGR